MASSTPSHDEHSGVLGLIAGSGIVLMQAAAVIPGLLPVLALALLLLLPVALLVVLPVVALGVVAAVLVGVPLGLWRLGARLIGLLRRPVTFGASARVNRVRTDREVPLG